LAGKIGDAIADTQRLYPGLLDSDPKLLFLLKCRQFIEMVSGVDVSESNSQVLSSFKSTSSLIKASPIAVLLAQNCATIRHPVHKKLQETSLKSCS
jgi:CTLH/CRA C-terminal to LisH motif domain